MKRAFEKSPLAFSPVGIFILAVFSLTGAKNVTPGEILWQEGVSYRIEGRQFQRQGNLQEAAAAYRKAIIVKPDYAEAYNDLGVILESMGDTAGAEDAYKAALKFKPDLGPAHSNLALLYEEANRIPEAAVHWGARSLLGPPGDPWVIKAREKLARYHLEIPESREEQARRRAREVRAAIETGKADLEAKQYGKAVSEFERALKADPSNLQAAHLLRWAKVCVRKEQARQDRQWKAAKRQAEREMEESRRRQELEAGSGKAAQAEQKAREAASEKAIEAARRVEAREGAEGTGKGAVREAVPAVKRTQQPSAAAPPQAQEIVRQIVRERSELRGKTVQELSRRAASAMREGRYQDAADAYQQMLMLDPGDRSAKQGLERARRALAKES